MNQRQDRDLLLECLVTLWHASIFVRSREKMHPTGLELYDQLIKDIEFALNLEPDEMVNIPKGFADEPNPPQ